MDKGKESLFKQCLSFLQCTHQLDEHQVGEHRHPDVCSKA